MCMSVYTMEQIVTKPSRSLTLRLQNKGGNSSQINQGAITIHAEETVAAKNAVEIIFRCSHLDNKDIFSKSVHIQYLATSYMFYI